MRHVLSVRAHWLWMIPLILLSFWLGARGLVDALWGDEYYTLYEAGTWVYGPLSPAGIWERITIVNPMDAPGFPMLIAVWDELVGWQPPALRVISLLLGMLALAFTYRLGSDFASRGAGLSAAAILAVSPFVAQYLHDLRVYAVFIFITVTVIWLYLRIITAPGRVSWRWLTALFVSIAVMLYMHYFTSLLLLTIGLYHLLFVPKDRRWWRLTTLMALAAALFLPWAGVMITGLFRVLGSDGLRERAMTTDEAVARLFYLFSNGNLVLIIAAVLLALLGLAGYARSRHTLRLWFFLGGVLGLLLLANATIRLMHEGRVRYLLMSLPLLALVVGVGLSRLQRFSPPFGRLAAVGIIAFWMAVGVWQNFTGDLTVQLDGAGDAFPLHRVRDELVSRVVADDLVMTFMPDDAPIWAEEHNDRLMRYYFGIEPVGLTSARTRQTLRGRHDEMIEIMEIADDRERLWLASLPDRQSRGLPQLEIALGSRFELCRAVVDEPGFRIELYARQPICCVSAADNRSPLIRYGEGIALVDAMLEPEEAVGRLSVISTWQIEAASPYQQYSYGIHILDAEGTLVAQSDQGLALPAFTCRENQLSLEALPPGEYSAVIIVYDWQSGARLSGETLQRQTTDVFPLGSFSI
jgi:hypothetical protein